jgi:hypothetical protein
MFKNYPILRDEDIQKNEYAYDYDTLEWNIKYSNLSLRVLSRCQKLSPYICAKYVVFGGRNGRYADCTEDAWIDSYDILRLQPHITDEELCEAHRIADQEDMEEEECEKMQKEDKLSKYLNL